MTREEGIEALAIITEGSISNSVVRKRILDELSELKSIRGHFPAKGILADIQAHSDLKISEETGLLIKEVCFNFV
ncbi:hypothetical protein [Shewanella woodyi]|uniref:Uncharacterized protein n=1 Tax=Shewanella woodyi (strain ATCC 51908 / MS32) TaxID=392500 RepID=B1KRJ2_SHEWM|nr:hypothetical protein [Shewanella woodyi]ACA87757.1 hypothetical protein Swoo_3492 [Shewanella woodyi ATCC 51908]